MKRACCICGVEYEPSRDKSSRCPKCKSEYNRKHYLNNKTVYVARANRRKRNVIAITGKAVLDYLDSHPCVDCGERDPVVLEFDHIEQKRKEVTTMVWLGYSIDVIFAEIAKCEVRCANCHRRVTARRAGWKRYRFDT